MAPKPKTSKVPKLSDADVAAAAARLAAAATAPEDGEPEPAAEAAQALGLVAASPKSPEQLATPPAAARTMGEGTMYHFSVRTCNAMVSNSAMEYLTPKRERWHP